MQVSDVALFYSGVTDNFVIIKLVEKFAVPLVGCPAS